MWDSRWYFTHTYIHLYTHRQLPLLGWLLRGRAHLNPTEFRNRNHKLVFRNSLFLLHLLQPLVFDNSQVCMYMRVSTRLTVSHMCSIYAECCVGDLPSALFWLSSSEKNSQASTLPSVVLSFFYISPSPSPLLSEPVHWFKEASKFGP